MEHRRKKRILSITVSVVLLLIVVVIIGGVIVMNNKPSDTVPMPPSVVANVAMTYAFSGKYADVPGFAEGQITLTPSWHNAAADGYYLFYFANDNGLLAGYDEFASVPITGKTVTYTVKSGTMLPPQATTLVAFESEIRVPEQPPTLENCVAKTAIPADKRPVLGDATFTFGAISDVHMNYEFYGRGAYQKWEDALNFFAEKQMDKVIVTGDMTGDEFEQPLSEQYQTYLNIIDSSDYPLEHIHEGIGNHGNTAVGRRQFVEFTSGKGEDHPFEDSPWFSLHVKGRTAADRDNLFLFMAQELNAPGDSRAYDNFSKQQIDWLETMLESYENTETNIFIILHSPFLNYGAGDRENGNYTNMVTFHPRYVQTMRLKKLLEAHKRVVVMSGHSHVSLYDGVNYSDESGTSCRMIHLGSGCYPATYHNEKNKLGSGDGRRPLDETYGSEAYTVAVYDRYIVYTGYNLSTNTVIPSACYILPVTV